MAKILVADDNSNVQKTVGLALAGLGVEVVAVNNGDAAVRKLPDVQPDLVLADIFMPVRNGYEVCEYVKRDARFSRVPVVLLVGAFDPLDEREAQRVGADGILKKPFVPPDPLIAMVKTLLDRSMAERLVAVGTSQAATAREKSTGSVDVAEPSAPAPEFAAAETEQEIQPASERLDFGEGERPIAFEQLLGLSANEPANSAATETKPSLEDDQILTSARDASLGDPIFWKSSEPEAEGEASEKAEAAGDVEPSLSLQPWKLDDLLPAAPPPAASRAQIADTPSSFELIREEADSLSPTVVEPASLLVQDAAAQASLTVQPGKAEDLAANPIEWMASNPQPPVEESPAPVGAADWSSPDDTAESLQVRTDEAHQPIQAEPPIIPVEIATPEVMDLNSVVAQEHVPAPLESASEASGWTEQAENPVAQDNESVSASSRLAENDPEKTQPSLAQASQSAEDTAHSVPVIEASASSSESTATSSAQDDPDKTQPALAAAQQIAAGVSRPTPVQQWADLAAEIAIRPMGMANSTSQTSAGEPASAPPSRAEAQPASLSTPTYVSPESGSSNTTASASEASAPDAPDPALVEAVVQRVLDKMRPQVVDIITKEFLRPVVQALVHREIQKK